MSFKTFLLLELSRIIIIHLLLLLFLFHLSHLLFSVRLMLVRGYHRAPQVSMLLRPTRRLFINCAEFALSCTSSSLIKRVAQQWLKLFFHFIVCLNVNCVVSVVFISSTVISKHAFGTSFVLLTFLHELLNFLNA